MGTSLAIQWLRFCVSNEEGMSSVPGQGTKITHATRREQNKTKQNKNTRHCKMKNGFDGLISRLDIIKLAASLKVCPFHFPK